MKRGHPTISESIVIKEKIYKCFCHGISAETASKQLGLDRKTVYAYYKKFSDEIITINEKQYFPILKSRLKQLLASYDNLLLILYLTLDSIHDQLEQKDTNRQSLQNQKLSIIREIRNILNTKSDLELKMPMSNSLEDETNRIILKHEKS